MREEIEAKHGRIALALAATIVAALFMTPASADTEQELKEARAHLEDVQSEANAATAEYDAAYGRFISTKEEIDRTQVAVDEIRVRVDRIRGRLGERAREAYQMGSAGMLELLFVSDSISDFSDRVVFLDRIAEEDSDLMIRADVLTEDLRRLEEDLKRLADRQADTVEVLREKKQEIYDKLQEAAALEAELEEKFEAELAAARALAAASGGSASRSTVVVQGGALQACPVPGSSFSDTFGAPRSDGRTHQGVDMMAPYGAGIYAATSGSVSHSSSDLGGNQAYVHAGNGDYTFYAHLQGYEGSPRSVSAGELIGYVGDTGNATGTPHLHFEYHPGGGSAVNPTPYVSAVC